MSQRHRKQARKKQRRTRQIWKRVQELGTLIITTAVVVMTTECVETMVKFFV